MARVSLLSPNSLHVERHAYCLCLHVRPATIFVAVINLAGSIICAMLTFFFMINNDYNKSNSYFAVRFVSDEVNRLNLISVLMYLLLALVSAMLLYGVIKSKPRYILPFFGIQFIDYLFTLPQFFASITNPYHYYVSKSKNIMEIHGTGVDNKISAADFDDMRNVWSSTYFSNSHVYTTSLLILTLIMIFKTYFLCVVWKCYRYLHMKELIPITLNAGNFDHENVIPPMIISRATNVPPPDYEEATKMPEYKPPEYTTVVVGCQNGGENNFQTGTKLDFSPPQQQQQSEQQSKNVV